ncbi:MAG: threonine--tRNA ligase [Candidatus Campbellbacteria bacterium]|nr:threonine--tRNA ligase [Candidatus Campbellbacteria bacterium]
MNKHTPEELAPMRHTLSHLMAAAVLEIYPDAKPTLGPAVDNGFYYDFDFPTPIVDTDLKEIQKRMKKMLSSWKEFTHEEVSKEDALKRFAGNEYKEELINEIASRGEKITLYTCGGFTDLCRGGHVDHPSQDIDADSFKISHLAGAYWRGDEKNKMLTRIYGFAFATKEDLEAYETQIEEAKKRDHKKLGRELGLFMFHETAPGMPYWLPKGLIVYNELVNFWREEHTRLGYQEIASPLVNKAELWHTSGHWEHYKEDMFIADMGENEVYGIKPMNCPNAMIVFQSMQVSYRDLPLRLSDTDRLHRYERSGTLNGLLRVRSFQQDDSHNFISEDMIASEYEHIFEICKKFYGIFGLDYSFRMGTRPEKFLGDKETWDKAEEALRGILEKSDKEYVVAEGDGAFYGPKIDIIMKDTLGRDWQMGTIQLDFQLPRRFDLSYAAADGTKKTPVVVHRVIYGSLERFIGIIIEHFAGALPTWLSPIQISILPISEKHLTKARELTTALQSENIRVHCDDSNETLGKKIRTWKIGKNPYALVLGDKEVESGELTLEKRSGEKETISLEALIAKLKTEISTRAL